MNREITITATDIQDEPYQKNDTELSVTVMRSCTFLHIRREGQVTAHIDISREDWQKLASAPVPQDS